MLNFRLANEYRTVKGKVLPELKNYMELSLQEKPPILQLLKDFPAFYGNRSFITAFTGALHRFLS
jgi:hypothetical protein